MNKTALRSLGAKIGPGILFAAASIGTSHLVQSTRAGAGFGLAMASLILIACIVKYPAFRFGSEYAAASGFSLVDSYFRQGRWAIAVLGFDTLVNIFVATAAIALVTAGLVGSALSLDLNPGVVVIILLVLCAVLLIGGGYHLFEQVTKGFVALLVAILVLAVTLVIPDIDWSRASLKLPGEMDRATLLFIIALTGWMPSPLGVAVFQSLWVCAKSKDIGKTFTPANARFDFNLGYAITAILALGFLILGTVLMYQPGIEVADSPNSFAAQLISLFTSAIGSFTYPIISAVAVIVMLSTLLTIIDAYPRCISSLVTHHQHSKTELTDETLIQWSEKSVVHENKYYVHLIIIQCVGAVTVLMLFTSSFRAFIDFATSVAFLTSPLMAYMNHRAMFSSDVAPEHRPSKIIEIWSLLGILVMGIFGVTFVYFGILGRGF